MLFIECSLSQSRRILSILMIIFLLVVVVANSSTRPIYYGNKVHLLCTYKKPISRCRFLLPGEEATEIELFEDRNVSEGYEYFGKGFEAGECGITLINITSENEGPAICKLTDYDGSDRFQTVEVSIFDFNHLHMPKIKILNSGPLKAGQTLAAECVTNDQYANISWLLNERILANSSTETVTSFGSKSILKHRLDTLDNGRTLKCRTRVSNYTREFVDTTLDLVVFNETKLIEPKIGFPFDISIRYFAFPRVFSTKWKINERTIYYRNQMNEFVSRERRYLGNNEYEEYLHIKNVTELNIHYNYTLQVSDASEKPKYYDIRIDDFIINDNNFIEPVPFESMKILDESTTPAPAQIQVDEEETTISFASINENSITTSPKLHFTKQQQPKGEKTRTTRFSHSQHTTTKHPSSIPRRTYKYIRKQQKLKNNNNTSTSTAEMTSVTSTSTTTTEPNIVIVMTKAHTNETTQAAIDDENLLKTEYHEEYENTTLMVAVDEDENEVKELDVTTTSKKNLIESTTTKESISTADFERFFIKITFVTMTLIIVMCLVMLCHYRHQVTILKTEIIQMNLENYYNQSCLYPSTFNDYTSTNFQQTDGMPFYIKRPPLHVNNTSSEESDISSNGLLSTYNTNSHLYQSIDADDIDNHVYDEIIHTMDSDEGKPNNYENNESFNNINEILIPSHCHTLMTIHEEEEEFEASQVQILSNLESTYI